MCAWVIGFWSAGCRIRMAGLGERWVWLLDEVGYRWLIWSSEVIDWEKCEECGDEWFVYRHEGSGLRRLISFCRVVVRLRQVERTICTVVIFICLILVSTEVSSTLAGAFDLYVTEMFKCIIYLRCS